MIQKEKYSFADFLGAARNNENKRELIKKYELLTGTHDVDRLDDQPWYRDYLSQFDPLIPFDIPEIDFFERYDIGLLQQLVAGSFSSSLEYTRDQNGMLGMIILVQRGNEVIKKRLAELEEFQLQRLFDIYFEELINLEILIQESEAEASAIRNQRLVQIQIWKRLFNKIHAEFSKNHIESIDNIHFSSPDNLEYSNSQFKPHSSPVEAPTNKAKSYDYQKYIEELRDNTEKRDLIEKYESEDLFGSQEGKTLEDQPWYTDYLSRFTPLIPFTVPTEDFFNRYDIDLLQQLVGASFSSILDYEWGEDGTLKMIIHVQSGDQFVSKGLDELWEFQVDRLYKIYIEELMNLEILIKEDETEKAAILEQRTLQFHKWNQLLDIIALKQAGLELVQ